MGMEGFNALPVQICIESIEWEKHVGVEWNKRFSTSMLLAYAHLRVRVNLPGPHIHVPKFGCVYVPVSYSGYPAPGGDWNPSVLWC